MEKENKKGRSIINLFDIVLIVIALVLGAALFLSSRGSAGEQDTPSLSGNRTPVRYSIELSSVEQNVVDLFKEGDPLVDREKKYNIGTIESVEVSPGRRLVNDYENNRQIYVEEPGRYLLTVTVITEGVIDERNITLDGGYILRIGKTVYGKLPGGVFQGTVVAIEREEA